MQLDHAAHTRDSSPAPDTGVGSRKSAVSPIGIAGAFGGALLFAYYLRTVGFAEVAGLVRNVGAGFFLVLLLSGLRQALRAAAWTLCAKQDRLRLRDAFVAFVTGDAIGNLTPFGLLASEGLKAVLARRHLHAFGAVSSLALENLFYSLSVAVMVCIGTLVFLVSFEPVPGARTATLVIGACALIVGAALCWVLYGRPGLLARVVRRFTARNPHSRLFARLDGIGRLEDRIQGFSAAHPGRVVRVMLLEFCFHAAAIAEIYLLLVLLVGSSGPVFLQAVVLETVNRVITVVFKFIPLRVGVDEAGSGFVAHVLGLTSATGVAIALTRKARTIVWSGVGIVFLVRRGVSMSAAVTQAKSVLEREKL